jgi:amidase/aspartyl-tRNA(Asn)/glutamyl-tRNA(Gln) amidotransferase subunit A
MERAGAIIIGKTNSPAFGFRGTCDNYLFGPSRNPFNTSKNTGGSSGGSAAAVADGLLPIAEGTDGGGSIRIPAAWCGVFGYKASFGRVPMLVRPNAFCTTAPFDFEGPITRSVEDAAFAMSALAGYHSRDPFSLDSCVDFLGATRRSIEGWKIAYSKNFGIFPVDDQVTAVVDRAIKAFEDAGAYVEEVHLPIHRSQEELSALWCRMAAHGIVTLVEELQNTLGIDLLSGDSEQLPPEARYWLEVARSETVQGWLRGQAVRTEVFDAVQSVLSDYRLLITPTLACGPVDNATNGNTLGPSEINGIAVNPLIGWCLTYPINFTGHPAASVPAGFAEGDMPVGMQIVGRRFADEDVFAASAAFERCRPWYDTYEICEGRSLK